MFDVGDEVYSKKFGEGVVICVDDNDLYLYPIHVQGKNSSKRDIFTPEGRYNIHFNDPDTDICILKVGTFKVGDHVISKHFGEGVVEHIDDPKTNTYPVQAYWIGACPRSFNSCEFYTPDGTFNKLYPQPDNDIIKKEDEDKMGQIAGVINYDIAKKMHEDEEKRSAEGKKFKVGERVWSPYFGGGVVTKNEAHDNFPIEVHWDDGHLGDYDFFMADGKFNESGTHPEMGIYYIDPEYAAKVLPDIMKELADEDDEGTVERMEDALNKKTEDAVNPAHYKVEGLPDAIDIINHLMHREQYEGFLWGNILKYAYRYGRKGDKAETAGKIEWYARQLKELCECEAEKEEGDKK